MVLENHSPSAAIMNCLWVIAKNQQDYILSRHKSVESFFPTGESLQTTKLRSSSMPYAASAHKQQTGLAFQVNQYHFFNFFFNIMPFPFEDNDSRDTVGSPSILKARGCKTFEVRFSFQQPEGGFFNIPDNESTNQLRRLATLHR